MVGDTLPRCGRISYTNDLPVYGGIDAGALVFPATLFSDVPSVLNRALLEGRLDISPVSSALYAEHPDELLLLRDICVSAPYEVRSIYCISAKEVATLAGQEIAITRESLTARALLRTICRTWYGFDPVLVDSDDPLAAYLADGSPCVLIGDKAVDASESVPSANLFDLGTLWRKFTGRGMVFAVWAVRADYADAHPVEAAAVADALVASLQWSLENMTHVIRRAQTMHPHREGFYAEYYRTLNFSFDDDARKALTLFFERGKAAGIFKQAPPLRFFDATARHVYH
jgi:chorismate dehydratase